MAPRLTSLFAAVCARPADDEPRQVLADALQELGDLRGEFITLQLACASGRASSAARVRALELERTLGRMWAETLGAFRVEFRRGFPSLVEADTAVDGPTWATVEVLRFGRFSALDAFLTSSPALTSLERVSSATKRDLLRCAEWRTPKLTAVELVGDCDGSTLELLAGLPRLAELACGGTHALSGEAWLWDHAGLGRLRLLRLRAIWGGPFNLTHVWSRAQVLPTLTIRIETFRGIDFELTSSGLVRVTVASAGLLADLQAELDQTLEVNRAIVSPGFTVEVASPR